MNDKLNPSIYTMPVVLERVRALGDLYAGVLTTRQSLVEGAQVAWLDSARVRAASFATASSLPSITA